MFIKSPSALARWGNETPLNCHSSEMKELLGLKRTAKLPDLGMGPRAIQGIKVWVTSKQGAKNFGDFHRVRAECPLCGKAMSAGRLHQHKCKKGK